MVAAAGDDPVTPGSRVKVALLAGEAPLFGTLVYLDAERLSVQTPGAPPIIVDRPQVKRLYVSQGLRRNTKKGLLAGAGAWLLFTGVIAAVDTLPLEPCQSRVSIRSVSAASTFTALIAR